MWRNRLGRFIRSLGRRSSVEGGGGGDVKLYGSIACVNGAGHRRVPKT